MKAETKKQVTITLSDRHKKIAQEYSKGIFGGVNLSGVIAYLIEQLAHEQKGHRKND